MQSTLNPVQTALCQAAVLRQQAEDAWAAYLQAARENKMNEAMKFFQEAFRLRTAVEKLRMKKEQ